MIWGAGSKGVSLVNTLADSGAIAALVDINPIKQGRFVPVTGHPVLAPEMLTELKPNRVIVLNPQYRDEIAAQLQRLGIQAGSWWMRPHERAGPGPAFLPTGPGAADLALLLL